MQYRIVITKCSFRFNLDLSFSKWIVVSARRGVFQSFANRCGCHFLSFQSLKRSDNQISIIAPVLVLTRCYPMLVNGSQILNFQNICTIKRIYKFKHVILVKVYFNKIKVQRISCDIGADEINVLVSDPLVDLSFIDYLTSTFPYLTGFIYLNRD